MNEKWYRQAGECFETVVSTRVRLARNLAHTPFPMFMTEEQEKMIVQDIQQAINTLGGLSLKAFDIASMTERDRQAMVERHVISVDMARHGKGVVMLSEDERISIMLNEEDHLRIQVLGAGMDLINTYAMAEKIDNALDERLHFAFDERLGYLTSCPTNLGTGMRASVMMHLPALQELGAIQQIAASVSKLGLTVRGAYGEGSQALGGLYQISNQVTLGISEQDAIANLTGICQQIMKQEETARERLMAKDVFEDRVWRAYGVLKTARLLSTDEAIRLLSLVRLGATQHSLEVVSPQTVTALFTEVGSGCIMSEAGEDMAPNTRDVRRANLVRTALG